MRPLPSFPNYSPSLDRTTRPQTSKILNQSIFGTPNKPIPNRDYCLRIKVSRQPLSHLHTSTTATTTTAMDASTYEVIMATPNTTPLKKTVHWEPLASKRIYYIHDSPSKSEDWERRRVFLHDEIKPVSRLGEEKAQEKGKGKEKKQVCFLLPPPEQWKGKEKEVVEDSDYDSLDEDFNTRDVDEDNSGDTVDRELIYLTEEIAHLGSDSSYSMYVADSDSDDEEAGEVDALGNEAEVETLDSMDWSKRAYHQYLKPKVADEDVSPVCAQYFVSKLRSHPDAVIDTSPRHYLLAESVLEAIEEVDRKVNEYKERINYPNIDSMTRKFVSRVEGYAQEAKDLIFGYTKVRSVNKRLQLQGCTQRRDFKFLVSQIGEIAEAIDGRSRDYWAIARRELDAIAEEAEDEE